MGNQTTDPGFTATPKVTSITITKGGNDDFLEPDDIINNGNPNYPRVEISTEGIVGNLLFVKLNSWVPKPESNYPELGNFGQFLEFSLVEGQLDTYYRVVDFILLNKPEVNIESNDAYKVNVEFHKENEPNHSSEGVNVDVSIIP